MMMDSIFEFTRRAEMLKGEDRISKGAPYGTHCLLEVAFRKILPFGKIENVTIKRRYFHISFNIAQIFAPKTNNSINLSL
jgi:hypothetical protein